jgi:tetrahydromethanopterin S-methyltransferase subunit A
VSANATSSRSGALAIVSEQLAEATEAKKCHACGCFQAAVAAFAQTEAGQRELAPALSRARATFAPRKYDCLGCEVCFPAIAENAFADAFPGEARAPLCPTDEPAERSGWPPLPGDYHVLRHGAPVAVCTLNSASLASELAARRPAGLAITGTLHTENLGIERIVRNVLANPYVRFLVLCGEDTRQAIGHLPGQSLAALCESGTDAEGRIVGARGKRPVLKNVTREEIEAFRHQVELVPLVGEAEAARLSREVESCAARTPGAFDGAPTAAHVPVIPAHEPGRLVLDPAGFLVVYPDHTRGLVLEHYRNEGVLDLVIQGATATAVAATALERGVVSRLDHAVYLGRELARAEESLRTGASYVQDRAPEPPPRLEETHESCGCSGPD